ncbi:hypothetical protein [Rhodobacter calidifons]|uniref:Subtilisin inhibitor-like n=1 Tax=Rhodobacter calidifons TaxID=2715277 RepID=A0ABX0G5E3_9RHOB|nr:hypothetical protein [Rhodobacter calidifons]NHB76430.1 hypothetical protein [Rhodobacter calidifons]
MSAEFRSKSHIIPSHGISESTMTGRRFTAMLTGGAAALALVLATAIPARADKKDDLAKALVAALVVGAIAHELKDNRKPAPQPEPVSSKRVPSVCAISIDGADRSVSLYPESCLRAEGFRHRLPRGCSNGATIFGERDRVYSAQCLRDAGFRVQGH